MNQMAYCGIYCSDCPAYKATVANDDVLREQTAALWSKTYHSDIKAGDINCRGCKSELVFGHCNVCEIRACSREKTFAHCGECEAFCTKLDFIFNSIPGIKERLEKMSK